MFNPNFPFSSSMFHGFWVSGHFQVLLPLSSHSLAVCLWLGPQRGQQNHSEDRATGTWMGFWGCSAIPRFGVVNSSENHHLWRNIRDAPQVVQKRVLFFFPQPPTTGFTVPLGKNNNTKKHRYLLDIFKPFQACGISREIVVAGNHTVKPTIFNILSPDFIGLAMEHLSPEVDLSPGSSHFKKVGLNIE